MNHSLQRVRRQFALQRFYRQRQQTLAVAAHEFSPGVAFAHCCKESCNAARSALMPLHLRIGEAQ